MFITKMKRTCYLVDFLFLADHRVKINDNLKKIDLSEEVKKLENLKAW